MDEPFELKLPVSHVHKPSDYPGLDHYSIRVTLRHTLAHIRQSIWILSSENELKPMFLSFRLFSESVSDSLSLSEILSAVRFSDVSAHHGLSLIIDYTLFNSPSIPHRDPVPDLFDVEIAPEPVSSTAKLAACFTRESLFSSVSSVSEIAAGKYKLAVHRFDLFFGGQRLQPENLLRDVLNLDVPPLVKVKLSFRIKAILHPISIRAKQPSEWSPFIVHVEKNASIGELKAKISETTGHNSNLLELFVRSHCFSKARGSGDSEWLSGIVYLQEDPENIPEVLYNVTGETEGLDLEQDIGSRDEGMELRNHPEPEIERFQGPSSQSEFYELDIDGNSFEFSTSECILSPEGYILLNAPAMAKLTSSGVQLGTDESNLSTRREELNIPGLLNRALGGAGGSTFGSTAQPSATSHLPARAFESDASVGNSSSLENTQNQDANTVRVNERAADNTVGQQAQALEHEEPGPNVQIPGNQGNAGEQDLPFNERNDGNVLQTLVGIFLEHRVVIFQSVLQIGVTLFFMGGDLFYELFDPTILTILATLSIMIAFFMFGIEISDWVDHNVLRNGNQNSLDYAILKCVSLSFRSATMLNVRICTAISKQCVKLAATLHQTRLERLEDEIFGNVIKSTSKRLVLQILQAYFVGVATIFPFLEHDMGRFFAEEHIREGKDIKKKIRASLKRLEASENQATAKATVQAQLRVPIETLIDLDSAPGSTFLASTENTDERDMGRCRAAENEELLRCYLSLKWLERNTKAAELPQILRRT